MAFLIFGLFWMRVDHAPLGIQIAFAIACVAEDANVQSFFKGLRRER